MELDINIFHVRDEDETNSYGYGKLGEIDKLMGGWMDDTTLP